MISKQMSGVEKWLLMNPVAQIIQDARYALVTTDTITLWSAVANWKVVVPFFVVVIVAILGSIYFKKNQKYFAEEI